MRNRSRSLREKLGFWPIAMIRFFGFGGASVLELVDDHDGDTYRAVYTVRFAAAVYVPHVVE